MIIEVKPVDNCSDCVFCEEGIWCKLMDGEHIDYDYENGQYQRIPMRWNDRERTLILEKQEGLLNREQRMTVRNRILFIPFDFDPWRIP